MPFPKTDAELREKGYRFKETGRCRFEDCGEEIEWWETPAGRMIPLDPGTMEPHFATCKPYNAMRKGLRK